MEKITRVLVCSASPDHLNHNATLRGYVASGFQQILGEANVRSCSYELADSEALQFQPELVLVFGSCMPATCVYQGLQRYCARTGALLAFWLHDDPYEFDFNFKAVECADIIFSNDKWAVSHFRHDRVYHLPLAADEAAHRRPINYDKERDVFFCGVAFPNRQQLLSDCAEMLQRVDTLILGAEWPAHLPFASNVRVSNDMLPEYYARSRVTLNIGRRHNLANDRYSLDASTPGPRTFEAAMAGAVQCYFVEGLEILDYFDPKQGEIFLFDSPSELRQHVEALRDDPDYGVRCSEAAQRRVIAEHTYRHRAQEILRRCAVE